MEASHKIAELAGELPRQLSCLVGDPSDGHIFIAALVVAILLGFCFRRSRFGAIPTFVFICTVVARDVNLGPLIQADFGVWILIVCAIGVFSAFGLVTGTLGVLLRLGLDSLKKNPSQRNYPG